MWSTLQRVTNKVISFLFYFSHHVLIIIIIIIIYKTDRHFMYSCGLSTNCCKSDENRVKPVLGHEYIQYSDGWFLFAMQRMDAYTYAFFIAFFRGGFAWVEITLEITENKHIYKYRHARARVSRRGYVLISGIKRGAVVSNFWRLCRPVPEGGVL